MIDWQPLLEGRVNGFDVAVGGVRIGDGVDALPFKELTQISPIPPEGEDSALSGDGQRGAVTQESPISALRRNGGYAYAGPLRYKVDRAQIRSIQVRGDALSTLPFKVEADIERLLGAPKRIQRIRDSVIYHYPERGFSVAWHAHQGCLDHITVGPVD